MKGSAGRSTGGLGICSSSARRASFPLMVHQRSSISATNCDTLEPRGDASYRLSLVMSNLIRLAILLARTSGLLSKAVSSNVDLVSEEIQLNSDDTSGAERTRSKEGDLVFDSSHLRKVCQIISVSFEGTSARVDLRESIISSKASLAASRHLAAVALGDLRQHCLGSREFEVKGAGEDRSLGWGRGGGTPRGCIWGGALDSGGGRL